ncbi:MAG: hypothetical protein PGN13_01550 [Patulibacter minatonensis]
MPLLVAVAVAVVAIAALAAWGLHRVTSDRPRGLGALRTDAMTTYRPPATRMIGTVDTTPGVGLSGDPQRGTILRSFVLARADAATVWAATVGRAREAGWALTEVPARDDGRTRSATGRRTLRGVRDARLTLAMGVAFDDPAATSPLGATQLHLSVSVDGRLAP